MKKLLHQLIHHSVQITSFIDHQLQFHVQLLQYIVRRCQREDQNGTICHPSPWIKTGKNTHVL